MKRLTLALTAAAALGLSACQTLAPYGPATGPSAQGWSQQQLTSDRWRVSYRGVGDPSVVNDRALLRAAELTLEQGREWFVVDNRWTEAGRDGGPRPSVSIGAGSSDYGRYRSSGVGVGVGLNFGGGEPTVALLDIRMGSGERPREAYDAQDVRRNLWGR